MNRHSGKLTISILALIVIAGMLCIGNIPYASYVTNMILGPLKQHTIVIDPGHGGYDPGKVGIDNSLEKDINLAIALQLQSILESKGFNVIMTRTDDSDYSNEGNGSKKTNDLNHRLNIIDNANPSIVVSIHQNSFSDSSVSGAQVFYYGDNTTDSESRRLADAIQTSLINNLDPDNHRTPKGNTSYYMLKKTAYPIVIVECGFLSNSNQAANLNDPEYQKNAAGAIALGIEDYLT